MKKRLLSAAAALFALGVFAPGAAARNITTRDILAREEKTADTAIPIGPTSPVGPTGSLRERPDRVSIRVAGYELMSAQRIPAPGAAARNIADGDIPDEDEKTGGSVVSISSTHGRRERPDKVSIRVAGYELLLEQGYPTGRKFPKYYGGRIGSFEIGFNGFRELSGAYAAYPDNEYGFMDLRMGKSIHFTFNVWTFSTTLTRNNTIGVTAAIGFTANNYRFENATAFAKIDRMIHPIESADPGHVFKKSKMNTFAIHFPLALEVNPARNFFFSVGGWVDLVTGSHMKWKSPKDKLRGLSPNFVQAGATVRVGFKNAYLFGSYNFVELFRHGRGPVFNPYTFGMGFGF